MHRKRRSLHVVLALVVLVGLLSAAPPAAAEQTVLWEFVRAVWYEVEEGSPFFGVDVQRDNVDGGATYAYLHRGTCGYDRRGFACDITTRVVPVDPGTLVIAPVMSGATVSLRSRGRLFRVSWAAENEPGAWHAFPDVLRADPGGVAAAGGVIRWAHAWGRGFGRRLGSTGYAYLLTEALVSRTTPGPEDLPPLLIPQP
jgi:hypothetical protein